MTKIYAACLASYNNGHLHGVWIDCEGKDADDIQDEVNAMLRASPFPNVTVKDPETGEEVPSAEEWATHDYESPVKLSEYGGIEAAIEAQAIEDLENDFDADAVAAAIQASDSNADADEIRETLEERYHGTHSTKADFAADLLENTGQLAEIPEALRHYFDYESYARDLEIGGDFSFIRNGGGLHVFANY